MKIFIDFVTRSAAIFVAAMLLIGPAFGQSSVLVPQQEKLLNGLKVQMWPDKTSQKVEVKLRIHAGASFDPQGKEGQMKMLAEAIFPNSSSREYFADDLGGTLELITNYDYIQINASSRPDAFLTLLETLAGAVSNPSLDKETTAAVKAMVAALEAEAGKDPAYVADRGAAAKLFGSFPYGRPILGTQRSLEKIDFADLRFAYDRLFGADNATLAVSGNFDPALAYRAARRFFGSWLKSDKKVPSTFRQPEAPDAAPQMIDSPDPSRKEVRIAMRGFSRNDKDHFAAEVARSIIESRLRSRLGAERSTAAFVRLESHILPGALVVGFSNIMFQPVTGADGANKIEAAELTKKILSEEITDSEYSAALAVARSERARKDKVTDWLDGDTYRILSVKADTEAQTRVAIADVKRVMAKLAGAPMAIIIVTGPNAEAK